MITLTPRQKYLLRLIVTLVQNGDLLEDFDVVPSGDGCCIGLLNGRAAELDYTKSSFDVLTNAGFLHRSAELAAMGIGTYAVTGNAMEAVASDFAKPPPPAPAQTFAPTITGGTGFQFGNHNQMTVQMAAETIAQAINNSTASPEKKEEVKQMWAKFWGNEATKTVLETLVSGAAKGSTKE